MAGLWIPEDTARALRKPTAADDKYSRGVLGIRTGSAEYPGAAVLGVEAAWRTGLGMVRYLGAARDLVLAASPRDGDRRRSRAGVADRVGNGCRDPAGHRDRRRCATCLAGDLPVVVDAGALALAVGAHGAAHRARRTTASTSASRQELGLAPVRSGSRAGGAGDGGGARRRDRAQGRAHDRRRPARLGDGRRVRHAVARDRRHGRCARRRHRRAGGGAAADDPAIDEHGLARVAAAAAWLHGRAGALASAAQAAVDRITALDVAEALPQAVAGVLAIA